MAELIGKYEEETDPIISLEQAREIKVAIRNHHESHQQKILLDRFKQAVVRRNELINRTKRTERELLLNRSKDTDSQTHRRVTKGLRDAVEMMNNQLNQSDASLAMLNKDSDTLAKTSDGFEEMTDSLISSKKLTSRLKNKDRTDRLLLYAGIAVFLLAVAYVLWRRSWIRLLL